MSPSRHREVSEILAAEIAGGRYTVGAKFPTEQDLQRRFGVGRHTVREALKTLSEQGLVGRRRKLGTRVLRQRPFAHYAHTLRDIHGLFHFADDTLLTILHDGFVTAAPVLADVEGAAGQRWLRLAGVRRLRRGDEPLCWSEIYVPARLPLDRATLRTLQGPVYQHCLEAHGLKLDHVQQEIRAGSLPPQIAGLLAAEPQSSALLVIRRYVDSAGMTFEVSTNLYPADRYSVRSIIRPRS